MNVQLLDVFLGPVVQEACLVLQLRDPGTDALATTDSRVMSCSRLAYGMIVSYANREFVKDTYCEQYYEQDTTIRLRNLPIESISSVHFIDNPYLDTLTDPTVSRELVENIDFVVKRNKALTFTLESVTESVGTSSRVHVEVEYIGGLTLSTDDSPLYTALVMQTVANYNRLPALGVASLQGNESTSRGASGQMTLASSPDAGDLLESVKTIVDPYVYYGTAESS